MGLKIMQLDVHKCILYSYQLYQETIFMITYFAVITTYSVLHKES